MSGTFIGPAPPSFLSFTGSCVESRSASNSNQPTKTKAGLPKKVTLFQGGQVFSLLVVPKDSAPELFGDERKHAPRLLRSFTFGSCCKKVPAVYIHFLLSIRLTTELLHEPIVYGLGSAAGIPSKRAAPSQFFSLHL